MTLCGKKRIFLKINRSSLLDPRVRVFNQDAYKFAKNDHQIKNAKWFVEKGAGTLLREEKLNSLSLKKKILEFLTNINKIKKTAKKSYQLGDPKSVKKILKLIND